MPKQSDLHLQSIEYLKQIKQFKIKGKNTFILEYSSHFQEQGISEQIDLKLNNEVLFVFDKKGEVLSTKSRFFTKELGSAMFKTLIKGVIEEQKQQQLNETNTLTVCQNIVAEKNRGGHYEL